MQSTVPYGEGANQGQRALKPFKSCASGSQEQRQFSLLALGVPDSYLHGWGWTDVCVGEMLIPRSRKP